MEMYKVGQCYKKKDPRTTSPDDLSIVRRVKTSKPDVKRAYSKINTIPKNMFMRNG